MPFRPVRRVLSRQEHGLRARYQDENDAGRRIFIQTILRECPSVHVGRFVLLDVRNYPKIGAPCVVFYVPTGAFRTDARDFATVRAFLEKNHQPLSDAFAKRA